MKKLCTMALMLMVSILVQAQIQNPAKFSVQLKAGKTAEAELVFTGKIAAGWHVYSTNLPGGGPTSATFSVEKLDGVELVGKLTPRGKEIKNFDKTFEMQLRYFENSVQFVQKIRFTKPQYALKGYLEYGACNDQSCLPPTQVEVHEQGKSPAFVAKKNAEPEQTAAIAAAKAGEKGGDGVQTGIDAAALTPATPANLAQQTATDSLATAAVAGEKTLSAADKATLWKPVVKVLQQQNGTDASDSQSWGYIFLMGFLGGLLALFTPCVWPIIPMTVSFFLKRAKDNRRKGIQDALTYGASIVVIYLALGLIVTRLFGASALNALSTSALFNVFFFLMLVVFAVSFFGWFEIRLPDKWGNAVDTKASSTTGLLSIFLMAFTLALVSFSCTGPIIGFLFGLADWPCCGHVWLCIGVGFAVYALCNVPQLAQERTQIGVVDEHHQDCSWLHRVGVLAEVPQRCRLSLWLAHLRSRGIPVALDCDFRRFGALSHWQTEVSERCHRGRNR